MTKNQINIRFDNRRESIAFFRAAGDENIARLMEEAEAREDAERRSRLTPVAADAAGTGAIEELPLFAAAPLNIGR